MDPNQMKNLSKQRIRIAELVCIAVCIGLTCLLTGRYALWPLFSESGASRKNNMTYSTISSYAIEGTYMDRNGHVIMNAGVSEEPYNYVYAYLLGYYSVNSGQENKYGLRGNLKDYTLFHLNEDNVGATVTLTTDNDLMSFCKNLLGYNEGSITVIDNKTGAVLALASNSNVPYDVNDPDTLLTSDVPEAQYRRGTYETDPPGSTFKIVTSAAALKKAEDDKLGESFFTYTDTGSFIPEGSDYEIHNAENEVFGDINLSTAFAKSVNTYFANLGTETGASRLREAAENFMIGKDIEIPFLTTLQSGFELDNDPTLLAQTSYGQGNTRITPVHLALIAQAVANDGVMMSPYIVDNIKSGRIPLYKHFSHKLSTCVSETVDEQLKELMHGAALEYGLDEGNYGTWYAKTGTAECANDRIHVYMVGFNEKYSFCISYNDSTLSSVLYQPAAQLVSYLNQM